MHTFSLTHSFLVFCVKQIRSEQNFNGFKTELKNIIHIEMAEERERAKGKWQRTKGKKRMQQNKRPPETDKDRVTIFFFLGEIIRIFSIMMK